MCGICGFNWDDASLVKRMCDSIQHRGPDDSGYFTSREMSLGHQRLSIIDVSEKGKQPMHNEDNSIWLVFNGEIYNFKVIREMLEKKHSFYTNTDSEVIIHAYEEWGIDCVKRFNGMFAFAIWDSEKKQLFLARDRLGIKPLFYYYDGERFIFSSEIKGIILHDIKRSLNKQALNQFLIYSYPINNETLLDNVYDLLPANYLVYRDGKPSPGSYWDLSLNIQERPLSYYVENVRKLLFDSVSRRLMSDVPLGASLSGGLDSSAVVAVMSKLMDEPVKTFTIGFGDPTDETGQARKVAEHCGTDHTEIIVDYEEINRAFADIVWHMEAPFGRPATLPTYMLAKKTKSKVTVSLVGEGSDEIFAGYNRYYPYAPQPNFSLGDSSDPERVTFYEDFLKYADVSRADSINHICSGYFRDSTERVCAFSDNLLSNLRKELLPENSFGPYLDNSPPGEEINSALLFELKTELTGVQLNRVDRLSMAHAVEMRVPFLDHELVEFSMQIPSKYKWFGSEKKFILQRAVSDLLPDDIIFRRKLPFHVPLDSYSKNSFIHAAESVLFDTGRRDLLNHDYFLKLMDMVKSGGKVSNNSLRQLIFFASLELWYKLFIEGDDIRRIRI